MKFKHISDKSHSWRRTASLLAGLLVPAGWAVAAPALPNVPGLSARDLAVWIAPVEGGDPWLSHRADVAVNPASTMKLVTSFAALDLLGPDYRWRTRWLSPAAIRDGHLTGDLYWQGSGDPAFDRDALAGMVRTVRARGIGQIDGRLVLDGQAFRTLGSSSELDPDEGRSYQVGPDALLTQFKTVELTLLATPSGWTVHPAPALPGLQIDNRLQRDDSGGECPSAARLVSQTVRGQAVSLSGRLPESCDGSHLYVPVFDHARFQSEAFAAAWQAAGGQGQPAAASGRTPAGARELARHDSPPLSQVLTDLNRYSNNVMARQVFLTLGTTNPQSGDTARDAASAVRASLARHGIDTQGFAFENGAGLSRHERVTAAGLGSMLRAAQATPFWAEFASLLPRPGGEGTLKRRLPALAEQARFKTGTLNDVRALAGYLDAGGRRWAVVLIANRAGISNAQLDQLLEGLYPQLEAAGHDAAGLQ